MTEPYVRVRLPGSGHEVSLRESAVTDKMQRLDEQAADRFGRPLPPKYRRRAPKTTDATRSGGVSTPAPTEASK